jgi:hypothetical protein
MGLPFGSGERSVSGLCQACRTARIGEEIEFIRYGDIPERSYNYRDSTTEDGISVYEVVDGQPQYVGWHFGISDREVQIRGRGVIVGWGSDGEPLVKIVKTIKK